LYTSQSRQSTLFLLTQDELVFYRQFSSTQEELEYWRSHGENLENTLQDTRAALDEFQVSSRELEEELEKELQTTEKAYNDLKSRCEHFKRDADEWKVPLLK
jgi:predicted  nucleic acid-binding Zn-ribbon protein